MQQVTEISFQQTALLIGFVYNYLSILEQHSCFCSLNGCENYNYYLSTQSHLSNRIPRI